MKRLPFSGFQSSLIADRRGSAIRPATQNPAKGKPLLRQPVTQGSSFFQHALAPCFLKAFAAWETLPPFSSAALRSRGFPMLRRPRKLQG
ncbi:MAG: hypothetical protein JRI35_04590 [Deltaproteobacteria bacterium]|nr:hypothetical protein [Deltaproteobacteria bacterium]